jgi:hypothetical protein
MQITVEKLKELGACYESIEAFPLRWGKSVDSIELLESLRDRVNFDWANWLIVRIMTRKQYSAYAIFAAEQVLNNFELAYPNDQRPRLAIEAAKNVLQNDTRETRAAAGKVAGAAAWAAGAAEAAGAAWAAWAAWAVGAAGAAGAAWAAWAAWAVVAAWAAASKKIKVTILNFGIELLKEEK